MHVMSRCVRVVGRCSAARPVPRARGMVGADGRRRVVTSRSRTRTKTSPTSLCGCWLITLESAAHSLRRTVTPFAMLPYAAALLVPTILLRRACGLRFVGLTGGISSGKSSVSSYLRSTHAVPMIDFDLISREVVAPGHRSGALNSIRKAFGDGVIQADGTLDRGALGKMIFTDPTLRSRLNWIMKVPIWTAFFWHVVQLTRQGHREILLDVPLLFEGKISLLCSETIVVYVSPEVQQERLMKRDSISASVASSKITSQWPLDRKAAMADRIIENNGSLEELHQKLDAWYKLHLADRQRKAWWREWVPTVPTMIAVALASPILLSGTALARAFWLAPA